LMVCLLASMEEAVIVEDAADSFLIFSVSLGETSTMARPSSR